MQQIICPRCNSESPSASAFCQNCGNALTSNQPSYPVNTPPRPMPPPNVYYQQPQYPAQKQPGIGTGVKVGIGIVIGIMVTMGACVACVIGTAQKTFEQTAAISQKLDQDKKAAIALLKLEDVEDKTEHGYITITGKVRNTSNVPLSSIKVHVDFFDANGKIIDTDYTYVVSFEDLAPGSAKAFKIMNEVDKKMKRYVCRIVTN